MKNNRKAIVSRYNAQQQEVFDYLRSKLRTKEGKLLDDKLLQKAATLRYAAMLMAQEKEMREANAKSENVVEATHQDTTSGESQPSDSSGIGDGANG